jgi:hypothetical protein
MDIKREPWFYGCLSWMIPGVGQFCTGRISRGLLFLLFAVGAGNAKDYVVGTTRFVGLLPYTLLMILSLAVLVIAAWDAVRLGRKDWDGPKDTPDPWFAVFLSLIVGLFGYVYLRKWFFSILWVILVVLGVCFIRSRVLAYAALLGFYFAVPAHVYLIASRKHAQMRQRTARPFLIVLALSAFLGVMGLYLDHVYGVSYGKCAGVSMEPTVVKGERVVENKLAYVIVCQRLAIL